jgi:drug/metabolite transporter (DMT)-like permease
MILKSGTGFKGNNKKFLFYRSLFGLLGVFLSFYVIDHLPLADAVVLNQMNPFFVLMLSAFFLGERIKKQQVLAISIAILGVTFIIRPQFDYTMFPALLGLSSAVFAAAAYTVIRYLRLTDHPQVIVFYFTGFSVVSTLPFIFWGKFQIPTSTELLTLLSVGLFATIAQLFMTHAYRYAEAGDLSIFSYGHTVFSALIGILLWSEIPDIFSLLGITLILVGAYINYRTKSDVQDLSSS